MEERTEAPLPASPETQALPPPAPPLITEQYRGNQYDLYSLIAAVLGGSTLLMCVSGGMAYYCVPIIPLVLGIIALRRASTSTDPVRTRNLAWLGIAGGGMGTLLILCLLAFMVLYFGFIFTAISAGLFSGTRR